MKIDSRMCTMQLKHKTKTHLGAFTRLYTTKITYYGLNHRWSLGSELSNSLKNIYSSFSLQFLNANVQCDERTRSTSSSTVDKK